MDIFLGLLSLTNFLILGFSLTRLLKPANIIDFILFYCIAFTGPIILMGYLLSQFNRLDDLFSWFLFSLLMLTAIMVFWVLGGEHKSIFTTKKPFRGIAIIGDWFRMLSPREKIILFPLLFTTAILGVVNLIIILFSAPHNWDSMTYHLARMAYYLQAGNLDAFTANYWAQVVHPVNSTLLFLYTYLISGRNENLTQIVQYIFYWISIFSVYGISRKIGGHKFISMVAALVFALLTECLMQSTTTQNDIILTAYLASAIYFILSFKESSQTKYIVLSGISMGLAMGVKASVILAFPALIIISFNALVGCPRNYKNLTKKAMILLMFLGMGISVFSLPAGYIRNQVVFGHPIGPAKVRKMHSFEGEAISYKVINGAKNVMRYFVDFLSLDGFPESLVKKQQLSVKHVIKKIICLLGIDLESKNSTRASFIYERLPSSDEDTAYWGIMGFGLIWVAVFLTIFRVLGSPMTRLFAMAAILYLFTQALAGPYDPWRGRYFITGAIFAAPVMVVFEKHIKSNLLYVFIIIIISLGCISAISSVLFRDNSPIFSYSYKSVSKRSVFHLDRIEQLTRDGEEFKQRLSEYENIIPSAAVVAVCLGGNSYEYPLFGEKLTRKIMPINSFINGLQSIPEEADYLLFSNNLMPENKSDIHLDGDWYIRNLTGRLRN